MFGRLHDGAQRIATWTSGPSGPFRPGAPKVFNEHLKLGASFFKSLSVAFIVVAIVRPLIDPEEAVSYLYGVTGLVFHGISHYIVFKLRDEE